MRHPLLSTDSLQVGYGKKCLVKDISITLEPGKIVSLVGPNGAGKSTILKTIIRQLPPQSGNVFISGQPLDRMEELELARTISIVMTQKVMPERMTCHDVVAAGRYPYTGRFGILSPQDEARIQDAMQQMHVENLSLEDFSRLSDGQRQRVMIARAICQQPQILILDEPTSYLDIRYKLEFLQVIRHLAKERNVAILMSLHELELVQAISDYLICVHNGKIERCGTSQEVFSKDYICHLYDTQKETFREIYGFLGFDDDRTAASRSFSLKDSDNRSAVSRPLRPAFDSDQSAASRSLQPAFDNDQSAPSWPLRPRFDGDRTAASRPLRLGYTTGTCAALAVKGALALLLTGHAPETVSLLTPAGLTVEVEPSFYRRISSSKAQCGIPKDAGDDPDVTDGIIVVAEVEVIPARISGAAEGKDMPDRDTAAVEGEDISDRVTAAAKIEGMPDRATAAAENKGMPDRGTAAAKGEGISDRVTAAAKIEGMPDRVAAVENKGMPDIVTAAAKIEDTQEVQEPEESLLTIEITGGEGVGHVTRPGLDQPVGAPAINSVPRKMIREQARTAAREAGFKGKIHVRISIPGGEELARKTFNPQLGVEGGLSILGSTGIVEPMSEQALIQTIELELRQASLEGNKKVILTPGNYGEAFIDQSGMREWKLPVIKCSNFIGDTLDLAKKYDLEEVLLVGHIGKLVKIAAGVMNTHSRYADCRMETFAAHAAMCGAPQELVRKLMEAATADACLDLLRNVSTGDNESEQMRSTETNAFPEPFQSVSASLSVNSREQEPVDSVETNVHSKQLYSISVSENEPEQEDTENTALYVRVRESILQAIQRRLEMRVKGAYRIGTIVFSNTYGILGKTGIAKD